MVSRSAAGALYLQQRTTEADLEEGGRRQAVRGDLRTRPERRFQASHCRRRLDHLLPHHAGWHARRAELCEVARERALRWLRRFRPIPYGALAGVDGVFVVYNRTDRSQSVDLGWRLAFVLSLRFYRQFRQPGLQPASRGDELGLYAERGFPA